MASPDHPSDATDAPVVVAGGGPRVRSPWRTALEWVFVVLGAVLVALGIRTFVAQAFYIPSESMEPVLATGDRVIVDKLTYGPDDIQRGDVIVFAKPPQATQDGVADLIKRVVGLPGETLVIDDGKVYIDGALLEEPYLPPGTFTSQGGGTPQPGSTTVGPRCGRSDPCVIPEGHLFVMGDNRSNSKDSRWPDVGYVSESQLVGRAVWRVWPIDRIGGL